MYALVLLMLLLFPAPRLEPIAPKVGDVYEYDLRGDGLNPVFGTIGSIDKIDSTYLLYGIARVGYFTPHFAAWRVSLKELREQWKPLQ
jgi:hypothetical protein